MHTFGPAIVEPLWFVLTIQFFSMTSSFAYLVSIHTLTRKRRELFFSFSPWDLVSKCVCRHRKRQIRLDGRPKCMPYQLEPWLLDLPKRVRETGTYQQMAARETEFKNRIFHYTIFLAFCEQKLLVEFVFADYAHTDPTSSNLICWNKYKAKKVNSKPGLSSSAVRH